MCIDTGAQTDEPKARESNRLHARTDSVRESRAGVWAVGKEHQGVEADAP